MIQFALQVEQRTEQRFSSVNFSHLTQSGQVSAPAKSRGARRSAKRSQLIDLVPKCDHCGCQLVALPGRQNTATLIRGRLSCQDHRDIVGKAARDEHAKACQQDAAKRRSTSGNARTTDRVFFRPDGTLTSSSRRQMLKRKLLAESHACSCCGQRLTLEPEQPNSCHLIRDRLSCPGCVKQARAAAKADQAASGEPPRPRNRFGTPARLREAKQLLAHDPRCVACGKELTLEPNQPNSAELVNHHLCCKGHAKLAAMASDGAAVATAKAGQRFPGGALQRWYVEGEAYASLEAAEAAAIELASLIGSTVEIRTGLGGCSRPELCQIVRPGQEAMNRESIAHPNWREPVTAGR